MRSRAAARAEQSRSSRRCLVVAPAPRRRRRPARRRSAAYSRGRPPGPGAEHQALRQRVRAQPVGAVDAHAGALARGVEARQRRRAVDVGVDPAHHVVHHRPHRDRARDRIDALVLQAQLAHERQLRVDRASRRGGAGRGGRRRRTARRSSRPFSTSFTNACDSRSRGPSSMLRSTGFGLRLAQVVVLQVAVAVLVEQPAALAAGRLGDEDAGERQAGRVVLDELHVLERRAGAVGQRHAVAGLDGGVGGEREDPAAAAGAQDDRLRR